jgi:hypothetical protein
MSMRDVAMAALLAGAVGLTGCGGEDEDEPVFEGTYFGDLVIMHDDISMSVVASTELVVGDGGSLAGSSLTTKSPTATVGEEGTITGTMVFQSGAQVDASMTITFPTLGTFTASGTASWSQATDQIGASLPTRQDGVVIGTTTFSLSQE